MVKDMVSIIVPVYNVEGYIDRCLQSMAAQTYASLEIILVNDGSTDNSGAICERYCQAGQRCPQLWDGACQRRVLHVRGQR